MHALFVVVSVACVTCSSAYGSVDPVLKNEKIALMSAVKRLIEPPKMAVKRRNDSRPFPAMMLYSHRAYLLDARVRSPADWMPPENWIVFGPRPLNPVFGKRHCHPASINFVLCTPGALRIP